MPEACSRVSLELTKLAGLMRHISGSPAVHIGLIDGPVFTHENQPRQEQDVPKTDLNVDLDITLEP